MQPVLESQWIRSGHMNWIRICRAFEALRCKAPAAENALGASVAHVVRQYRDRFTTGQVLDAVAYALLIDFERLRDHWYTSDLHIEWTRGCARHWELAFAQRCATDPHAALVFQPPPYAALHSHLCAQLESGRIAALKSDLQLSAPRFEQKQKDWEGGGCLILALGLLKWITGGPRRGPEKLRGRVATPFLPRLLAVWESWDETPYHVGVQIGHLFLDGGGVSETDALLADWKDCFHGGAYLGTLSPRDSIDYGFPRRASLSLAIAEILGEDFGPFDPRLLFANDELERAFRSSI